MKDKAEIAASWSIFNNLLWWAGESPMLAHRPGVNTLTVADCQQATNVTSLSTQLEGMCSRLLEQSTALEHRYVLRPELRVRLLGADPLQPFIGGGVASYFTFPSSTVRELD